MNILYIILFIVCLSTLVMIHELGHLLTAKMFKVYCFEYSIGFGPKLFSRKRKNGETYFSLRAIPFGGFVSMYGEEDVVPEGLVIDPNRSLNNIKKWQKAIIMSAGIVMNFLLAIVMFFVYEAAFPKYTAHYSHITVSENSLAYNAGLRSNDFVYTSVGLYGGKNYIYYDTGAIIHYDESIDQEVYFGFDYSSITIKDTLINNRLVAYSKKNTNTLGDISSLQTKTIKELNDDEYVSDTNYLVSGYIDNIGITSFTIEGVDKDAFIFVINDHFGDQDNFVYLCVFINDTNKEAFTLLPRGEYITVVGEVLVTNKGNKLINVSDDRYSFFTVDYLSGNWLNQKFDDKEPTSITFNMNKVDEEHYSGKGTPVNFNNIALTKSGDSYRLPNNFGVAMQLLTSKNTFKGAVKQTFVDFGEAASVIYKSLGQLFTDSSSWQNVGGIIAIGVTTTRVLQEAGLGAFLFYWSLISVNLGIINLLPFPGLDGWHLLVVIIEGISKKEIPAKFKNYASAVGLILLFALMIMIVIKDVITFI